MRRQPKRTLIVEMELADTDVDVDFIVGATSVIFQNGCARRTARIAENPKVNVVRPPAKKPKPRDKPRRC